MFSFLLKSGTYLFYWKKFRTQIISIIVSMILIWLIFGIYEDLIRIFELEDTSTLLYLLLGKWILVALIILYNIKSFQTFNSSSNNEIIEKKEIIFSKKSQEILDKKVILTRTDLILKKYKKNK